MAIDVMEAGKNVPKVAPTDKLGKWFFESLGDFFASIKEKFTTAVDSIKKIFWVELNVLESDVKKNQQTEKGLESISKNDLDALLLYLSHQQGPTWIKQIIRYAETRERPEKTIYHNMANNVNISAYNKQFWTRCATLDDLEKIITPTKFLLYWEKIYNEKAKKYASRTEYDRYIFPLAKKYNQNPDTIRTFIGIESDFVASAWKGKTYVWLMQISPQIAKSYGFSANDRLDPAKNIEMWIRYMADNMRSVSSVQKEKTYAMLMRGTQNTDRYAA